MTKPFNTICLVGLGYIGLPTAVIFALSGVKVVGFDVNSAAVEKINRGETHIVEPGLDEALRRAVAAGYLHATTSPEAADAFLIAVPTPFRTDGGGHEPDLSYVEAAARSIAPALKKGDLVVLESTSPVGATELMAGWLAEERPDLSFPQWGDDSGSDVLVAHCPERILPGFALTELIKNDRIIGGITKICADRARELYELVVEGNCVETDCRTAEMAKLTENSFRDVNIAFANELSLICDRLGINVWELIRLANRHPRVKILQPGPGVGGHCIAVDPWFIVSQAPDESRLIRTAREVNDGKPEWVLAKIHQQVAEFIAETGGTARITCFGIAFKANIDDLRESPALQIATRLAEIYPGQVDIVEPYISTLPAALQGKAQLVSLDTGLGNVGVGVMLVDHDAFKMAPAPAKNTMRLVDTRGLWVGR